MVPIQCNVCVICWLQYFTPQNCWQTDKTVRSAFLMQFLLIIIQPWNVIVITFYLPSCLGQETVKGPFGLQVKLPPVYHTRWRIHTDPLNCWTSSREAVNTNFYSLWFGPTGNRTRVYRFSSRRSINSTTESIDLMITIGQCTNTKNPSMHDYAVKY